MGNRSLGPSQRGVQRTLVKLPGALVHATLCVPRAHAHALWLLPWVEGLLGGRSLADLIEAPPWPAPADPLVTRRLLHTLIDLRWAVPVWSRDEVAIDPTLRAAFRHDGRVGLARLLFDAQVRRGEWWAEGLSGILLSRQASAQFDWDHRRRPDHEPRISADLQALVDANNHDLIDLLRKLGAVKILRTARDRVFLGSPLIVGDRKDILFPLVGTDLKLLPAELGELEPVLEAHAPTLFGERTAVRSRVVQLARSPVERLTAEVERLPGDPAALGPLAPLRERVTRLAQLVTRSADELTAWLDAGLTVRPVLGPSQRHFDAVAEMCARLAPNRGHIVLLTSAFLNPTSAREPDGLADALAAAPDDAQFLVVYGHASEDLPDQQYRDMEAWQEALLSRAPSLSGRVRVIAGRRRSHEKAVLTSEGDWMVGSWNAASSRPHTTVFECSLAGRSTDFGKDLLDRLAANVEHPGGEALISAMRNVLTGDPSPIHNHGVSAVARLRQAVELLGRAVAEADDPCTEAWTSCIRAVRAALQPFLATAHAELVDEQQTRDAFLAQVRSTQHDVLLASDRLADSGFDGATLRDLRGDGRSRRTVRVVWGREWEGRRGADPLAREQLKRARKTVLDARELLGPALLTNEEPMENHAKLLVVDGLRGLVTSENLLAYGGEKGRHESRELGLLFWSPSIARHILGRMLLQWPDALDGGASPTPASPPLAWVVAGNESWHGLAAIADELDFEWSTPDFLEQVVRDELARAPEAEPDTHARRRAWATLEARAGRSPFRWICEEGKRLGLVTTSPTWTPYDAAEAPAMDDALARAEAVMQRLPAAIKPAAPTPRGRPTDSTDPLVARVLSTMASIPAGNFLMGDDRVRDEWPRHQVIISRPFLLGKTPVTQGLWQAVMGSLPHLRDVETHPDFPIIHISRAEMLQFLERLNNRSGGGRFELPTEAQWEYACLAGADTIYCFGDDPGAGNKPGLLERYAWTKRSAGARIHRVGELEPNAFGLHDMHGLVYETMRDGPRVYTRTTVTDPIGPVDGPNFVARGGFWGRNPVDPQRPAQEHFRCASRQIYEKSHRVSFRLARRIKEGS